MDLNLKMSHFQWWRHHQYSQFSEFDHFEVLWSITWPLRIKFVFQFFIIFFQSPRAIPNQNHFENPYEVVYNGLTTIKLDYLPMEEITSLLKKLDNSNLKSGPCGIVTVKNMLTLFLLKFRSIFMVFLEWKKFSTMKKQYLTVLVLQNWNSLRLVFDSKISSFFISSTSSDWPNLLANEIVENLKASTSICFNSIWDPCW